MPMPKLFDKEQELSPSLKLKETDSGLTGESMRQSIGDDNA